MRLHWLAVATTPPVTAYELQHQSVDWNESDWPDDWTAIGDTLEPDATAYLHDDFDPDRRCRYRLRARSEDGATGWTDALPEAGVQPQPGAPTLTAQTAASGSVMLNWSDGPASATRWDYHIRRGNGDWSDWTSISGANAATTSHTVSGLTEDARYGFQLRAVNASGKGEASNTVSAVAGLTPNDSTYRSLLSYSALDSTGAATRSGSYAFLKSSDDLNDGAATTSAVIWADALLLNDLGSDGRSYAGVLDNVNTGDRLRWFPYGSCYYEYRVTKVLTAPTGPARTLLQVRIGHVDAACDTARVKDVQRIETVDHPTFEWTKHDSHGVGPDGIRIMPRGRAAAGGHTYRLDLGRSEIVLDVPIGMRLRRTSSLQLLDGTVFVTYADQVSGVSIILNPETGVSAGLFIHKGYGGGPDGIQPPTPNEVVARFRALIESIRRVPQS